jgi:NADH:ubiquinone oxidoreductase subunit D
LFSVTLVSDDSEKAFFCKVRAPSYFNLQILPKLLKGGFIGDLAALIGTIDLVLGEIDR